MSFTVVWKPQAERNLADLWIQAADRAALTQGVDSLELRLRANPGQVGESRVDFKSRISLEPPLGIAFRIHEQDRIVEVLRVWAI